MPRTLSLAVVIGMLVAVAPLARAQVGEDGAEARDAEATPSEQTPDTAAGGEGSDDADATEPEAAAEGEPTEEAGADDVAGPGDDADFDGDVNADLDDGTDEEPAPPGTDPAWIVGAGAVAGLAAVTGVAALIAWSFREGHVSRFNSDECISPTMTRRELCYDNAYVPGHQAEVTTAVTASIAGAAAITAFVLFLVAPSRAPVADDGTALSCGAGPGSIGIACGARF